MTVDEEMKVESLINRLAAKLEVDPLLVRIRDKIGYRVTKVVLFSIRE
jgi:hypothetical protein